MENEKSTFFPNLMGIKYKLRKTDEEVEVITSNQPENGARSEEDWVTYIDSNGIEHIKEHLNLQLDFKIVNEASETWKKILEAPSWNNYSVDNLRIFDMSKELTIKCSMPIEESVNLAKTLVEKVKSI